MKRLLALIAVMTLSACEAEQSAANRSVETNAATAEIPAPPPAANSGEPAAPEGPQIPERFRGLWAEDQRSCSELTHHSRLVIGDDDLRFPDFVLEVEQVTESGDSFAVKGRNKKTDAAMEAQYFIDVTGNILTDGGGGGAVRVRCG